MEGRRVYVEGYTEENSHADAGPHKLRVSRYLANLLAHYGAHTLMATNPHTIHKAIAGDGSNALSVGPRVDLAAWQRDWNLENSE